MESNNEKAPSVKVHQSCQKTASNSLRDKRKSSADIDASSSKVRKLSTQSSVDTFDWKTHVCFVLRHVMKTEDILTERKFIEE